MMVGRDRTFPCSGMKHGERTFLRLAATVPHRRTLSLPALFCGGVLVCFFLIAHVTAATFVSADCSCSLSGYSVKSPGANNNELVCLYTRQGASSSSSPDLVIAIEKLPDKASTYKMQQDVNAEIRETVRLFRPTQGFQLVEEYYGDTKTSFIFGRGTSFGGQLVIFYRDTYAIVMQVKGFGTGQEVKSILDRLEPCMKKAVDKHAGFGSGTSGSGTTAKPGSIVPGPRTTTSGTGTAGEEEESLDDLLTDLGDEINEDLPLPVNWTGVPEALGNSVTPAMVAAIGALAGGIAGVIAVLVSGIPWPVGSSGGGGSGTPDSRPEPEPEPGTTVQEPGEGTPAAESPAALPAEPALPPPADLPPDASAAEGTVLAEPAVAPAGSEEATPIADETSPDDSAAVAADQTAPAGEPAGEPAAPPVTGKRVLTPDEEDLRDHIKQMKERSQREAGEWEAYGEVAGLYETGAKAVTAVADIAIDIGSVLIPGVGSTIKSIYSAAKTTLSRGSESYYDGEGFWWGMGKGAVEATVDKALDVVGGKIVDKYKGKIPLFGDFKAPKGVDLGNLSPAGLCKRLLGNKTPSYLADQARETLTNALANFAQGKLQSRIFFDPLKRLLGISKPG